MFEIWSLLISSFDSFYGVFSDRKDISIEKKEKIFNDNVVNVYEKMKIVYNDYTESFKTLLLNIDNKENPEEAVKLFKMNSLNHITSRSELKSLGKEIVKLQKAKYLNSIELQLFCDFARSIDNFFHSVGMSSDVSWYSAFINEFEEKLKFGENPLESKQYQTIRYCVKNQGKSEVFLPLRKKGRQALYLLYLV